MAKRVSVIWGVGVALIAIGTCFSVAFAGRDDNPAPERATSSPEERKASALKIRTLGLAIHEYEGLYHSLPPAAILNREGKALLSWRVLLLPYLGQRKLFREFRLEEPWDSPHNKTLLSKM